MSNPAYYDKRADFWKKHYEMALTYEEYLKEYHDKAERWIEFETRVPNLTKEQINRVQGHNRILNILAMVGIWCGDCSRQLPMIRKIAENAGEKVNLRLIEREISLDLMED